MKRFLVFSFSILLASHALADEFAAIAYNAKTGATALSQKQLSAEGAQQNALSSCGFQCQVAVWAKNSFVAIAAGQKISSKGLIWQFGWSSNDDRERAKEVALRECRLRAGNCEIKAISGTDAPTTASP